MIINFKVKNFYSIKEEQEISFSITKKDKKDDSSFLSECGNLLNNTIAIVGHNASGKTNVLKALSFCLWFVKNSYEMLPNGKVSILGVMPHKLSKSDISSFEMIFENNNREFQYKLDISRKGVQYEFLGEKKQRGYSVVYELKRTETEDNFMHFNLPMLNKGDKDRFAMRKNISLFSFLQNTGHLPEFGLTELTKFESNLGFLGKSMQDSTQIFLQLRNTIDKNSERFSKILKFLRRMDFSIEDIVDKDEYVPFTNVTNPGDVRQVKNIIFKHSSGESTFDLDFFNESNGTQRMLLLLDRIFQTLEKGGILVSDEIETSIHPMVIRELIKLFADDSNNQKHAQIIFSTHIPLLLEDRNKTQIYLVEKNEELSSEIYRLDDVEGVRNDDNFCNKYLAGAYGAIGNIRRI